MQKNKWFLLFINIFSLLLSYYACILFHEWAHGTAAWLLGFKASPFDVDYGGWGLFHVDENVNYLAIIFSGQGWKAAIVGIAGVSFSLLFWLISLIAINSHKIQKKVFLYAFFYWCFVINTVPLLQYFTLTTFSSGGDIGRFTHGLDISPWWIFIPGTVFVIFALWRLFSVEILKAYKILAVDRVFSKKLLLLTTLILVFLFIYTHGYNPLTDQGTNLASRILSVISISMVPVLYIICNPSRK